MLFSFADFFRSTRFRYGTLIVFANYLVEVQKKRIDWEAEPFPKWLIEHREITQLLSKRSLD
jgi:hypothetical protein